MLQDKNKDVDKDFFLLQQQKLTRSTDQDCEKSMADKDLTLPPPPPPEFDNSVRGDSSESENEDGIDGEEIIGVFRDIDASQEN